jgi:Ser/Thr protein kinase RdoA (MazF antagonist)
MNQDLMISKALSLWGLEGAEVTFVAGRENRVYRARHKSGDYAVRFKRVGYRNPQELQSELYWMEEMDRAGLSVPRPLRSKNNLHLEYIDEQYVDVIGWLSGAPLVGGKGKLTVSDPVAVYAQLGEEMAKLHLACDNWCRPSEFTRWHWDSEGLLGDAPLWGRFWENPTLSPKSIDLFTRFRSVAKQELVKIADGLDYGLIHADMVRENIMIDGSQLHVLDFDDGGFGFRLFDIATALLKNRAEPQYDDIKSALIQGYKKFRLIDETHLELFMALRAVTYVGWIVPRMEEDGSEARNARFILRAEELCDAYLTALEELHR